MFSITIRISQTKKGKKCVSKDNKIIKSVIIYLVKISGTCVRTNIRIAAIINWCLNHAGAIHNQRFHQTKRVIEPGK